MEPSGKIIIVEGNISAGKSTLCRRLQEELDCALFLEPTVANPFLEKFYKDPKKYALPLQLWILKQRYVTYGTSSDWRRPRPPPPAPPLPARRTQ